MSLIKASLQQNLFLFNLVDLALMIAIQFDPDRLQCLRLILTALQSHCLQCVCFLVEEDDSENNKANNGDHAQHNSRDQIGPLVSLLLHMNLHVLDRLFVDTLRHDLHAVIFRIHFSNVQHKLSYF